MNRLLFGILLLGACGGPIRGAYDPETRDMASAPTVVPDMTQRPAEDLSQAQPLDMSDTTAFDMAQPPAPDLAPGAADLFTPDLYVSPPVNATCATATPVSHGAMLAGDTRGATDDLHLLCRSGARGAVVYYGITLQSYEKLTALVTPGGSTFDGVVRVLDSCAATGCMLFADAGIEGASETATYTNTSSGPQSLVLAVSSYNETAPGPFTLKITVEQQPIPPGHAKCAAPMQIADGMLLTNQDASLGSETQTAACRSGAAGKVLYYRATVPPTQQLRARVTAATSWDPVLRLIAGCGVTACVADSDANTGTTETLVWQNTKATAQTVLLAVGSYSGTNQGKFTLDVHIENVPPPPTNTSCANAMALTGPSSVSSQDANLGVAHSGTGCSGSGKNLFYSIVVPSNHTLKVVMTPLSGYDAIVRLILGTCPSSGCIAYQDGGNPETLTWKNTGADQKVVIAMGPWSSTTAGAFDATIDLIAPPAPPPNASCMGATPVAHGAAVSGETLDLAPQALDGVCLPSAKGKVLFYALSLQPGQTLEATATPNGAWDPVLRLLDACNATFCVATGDGFAAGVADSLSYTNNGMTAQDLVLAVGGYAAATVGKFNLAVQITP